MIMNFIKYLFCLVAGSYVVSESLQYGQYVRYALRGRFHSLERAKAFARKLVPDFGDHVVVLDGMSLHPLYIYRRRHRGRPA